MTSVNDKTAARYDDLPYNSYAYLYSAPEQLAAVASLFGLPSPEVASSRVLELGCASGGNLIPFALRYPGARAVGLDISGVQIARGQDAISRLGIANVTLEQADFLQVDPASLGEFDYILAHGVYSWVSPEAQQAVLDIIGRCLSSDGVAFVSYNTYPGWKSKEILRDAMLLHGGLRPNASEQVAYGRSMLAFLEAVALKEGATAAALSENLAQIMHAPVHYLAHDYLEPFNLPCYFHEFIERTGTHGLVYLGEAQPSMMMPSNYSQELSQQLYGALGQDQVRVEQYLDFAISRSFRQSLLVRAERGATLQWKLEPGAVRNLHFAANLSCKEGSCRLDGQPQEFMTPHRGGLTVGLSGLKQAIGLLGEKWPGTVARDQLFQHALSTQGDTGTLAPEVLSDAVDELLETLILRGMARIRLTPVDACADESCMMADPLVRRQVADLPETQAHVANAWHETVDIGELERFLIPALDGSMGRGELVEMIASALRDGRLTSPDPELAGAGSDVQAIALATAFLTRMRQASVLRRT